MMQRAKLLVGIVSIWSLVWAPGCSKEPAASKSPTGETVDLRLTFEAGRKWHMEEKNNSSVTLNVQGQEDKTEKSLIQGSTIEVESVEDDGSAWLVITHDRIAVEGESVDQKSGQKIRVKFDSATDPVSSARGEAKALAALLGLSYRVRLSDQGKVLDFKGLDEMYRGIVNNLGLPQGVDTQPLLESMKSMFGETIFREKLEDVLAVYPPQPVGISDTWETQDEFFVGFLVTQDKTHTLKEIKNGVVLIEVNATIDSGKEQLLDVMLRQNISDLNGTYRMTIELDEQTGWIKNSVMTEKTTTYTRHVGDPQAARENQLLKEVETTFTVKIDEIK